MEDNLKNYKMKDNLKMEDDLRNAKWKMTNKNSTKCNNNLNQYKFKNKIVQIGCGSAPGNLVY